MPAARRGPRGRPSGRGGSITATQGGHRLGAPFSQGPASLGPGGAWGLEAACSLSPLSEGARRGCLPWASSGWWGEGCPPWRPWSTAPAPVSAAGSAHPPTPAMSAGRPRREDTAAVFLTFAACVSKQLFPREALSASSARVCRVRLGEGMQALSCLEPGSAVAPSPGSWVQLLQPVSSHCRPPRGASLSRGVWSAVTVL